MMTQAQALQQLTDMMQSLVGGSDTDEEYSISKAWTTAGGLVNYNLERPAYSMYPVLTPIRNKLERFVDTNGGTSVHWKTITAINTTNVPIGVSEGNRGGAIQQTLVDRLAVYVSWGLENFVTYQAQWASENFDNAIEKAVLELMESVMVAEEKMILGGNNIVALGTTNTPTLAQTTGGVLADGNYYVVCMALTSDCYQRVLTGLQSGTASVTQVITRTNTDGTSDTINGGTAAPSATATINITAGSGVASLSAVTTAIQGAVAYAWYIGTTTGHQYLQAITTLNSIKFTTAVITTSQDAQTLQATDYSKLGIYSFDGFLYQTGFNSAASGSYYVSLANGVSGTGTHLTSDGAGGVTEFETALASFYNTSRLSPDTIYVNATDKLNLKKLIVGNNGSPLIRFTNQAGQPGNVVGAVDAREYFNTITGNLLAIQVHPYMPQGTLFFSSDTVPYPHPGTGNLSRMHLQRDYFQIQWPPHSLKYEYGVYACGVLQIYFLPAFGIIANVAP